MTKTVYTESSLGGYITSPKGLVGKNQEIDEDGIFSQRLFGPIHNYKCKCGNLKTQVLDKDKVCPKCGVVCGSNDLRLTTFGKIKLIFSVIKPTKKSKLSKIVGKQNNSLLEPKFADASKNEIRYLAVQKDAQKIIIVNELNNPNFYTIPFRITGLYSFILVMKYLAKYWNLELAKEYFDKEYIISDLKVIPPDLRMAKIDPEKNEIRSPPVNEHYTSLLNLNKSNSALSTNMANDEMTWMGQIHSNVMNNQWDQEIVDISVMEMDGITARYQYFVNRVYQEIYNQLSGKLGLIRSSILGRTIEFSARSVIRVDPSIKPYEVKVSKKILYKLWHPYFLHYLSTIEDLDYDKCFEHISSKNYEECKPEFNRFLDWFMKEHPDKCVL